MKEGLNDCRRMLNNIAQREGLNRAIDVATKNIEKYEKSAGRFKKNSYIRRFYIASLMFERDCTYIQTRTARGLMTEEDAAKMLHNIGIK